MGVVMLMVICASRIIQAGHVQNLEQATKRMQLEMKPKEDRLRTGIDSVLITKRRCSGSLMREIDSCIGMKQQLANLYMNHIPVIHL